MSVRGTIRFRMLAVLACCFFGGALQTLRAASPLKGRHGRSACETIMVFRGSQYGGWWYDSREVKLSTIVYSFGLGEDTSWDEALLSQGATVYGYDPTPRAESYVKQRKELWESKGIFYFSPIGLSIEKGTVSFTKPKSPTHVSMRQGAHPNMGETVQVAVDSLKNLLQINGHNHIDILKIDIETSEYAVLESFIEQGYFPFSQLLVEFHDNTGSGEYRARFDAILQGLFLSGFAVMKNSALGEMSFKRFV